MDLGTGRLELNIAPSQGGDVIMQDVGNLPPAGENVQAGESNPTAGAVVGVELNSAPGKYSPPPNL
jgi:hypothetical protein